MEFFVNVLKLLSFMLLCGKNFATGQLSSRESLLTSSECNLPNANLDCGSDAVIAVQKVQYGYRSTCGTACCQYNVTDCLVNASNRQDIIRVCYGQPSCNVPTQQTHDFCSFGKTSASYVYLEYFCIPKSRITDVCSTTSLESTDGKPLYLTNAGYPSVTVGTMTCTCSFEAQSCSSDIQNYVIDSDLYHNTTDCQQGLNFTNAEGVTLDAVGCESYYNNYITGRTLSSNYIEITFVSASTQNREGFFFTGLTATEPNVTISLSCSPQPASWCIDCSTPASIAYGNIMLDVPGDLGYNASATINCDPDYVANTSKIFCMEQSTWEAAACLPKPPCAANEWTCKNKDCIPLNKRCDNFPDCSNNDSSDEFNCTGTEVCPEGQNACYQNGSYSCVPESTACVCGDPTILHGTITLNDLSNSSSGATAMVTCDAGYNATSTQITCFSNGLWEVSLCIQNVPMSQSTATTTTSTSTTTSTVSTTTSAISTTAVINKPKGDDNSDNAATIVVPIVVLLFVTIVLVCQYVILWKRPRIIDQSNDKERIISRLPLVGFPVVTYRFCSRTDIFHLKHHPVQENGHVVGKYSSSNLAQYDMIGRTGIKPGTFVTDTGRSSALHDQQQRRNSHVDNDEYANNQRRGSSVRHDDIHLEHHYDVPKPVQQSSESAYTELSYPTTQGYQHPNSLPMRRGLSAATNSQTDLPAVGVPRFQHGVSHPSILKGSPVTHPKDNQKNNAEFQLTGRDPHARAHERAEQIVPQRRPHAKFIM